MLPPATDSLFAALVSLGALLLYRALLPKPIPGIPYDKTSAKRLLGDVPDALKYRDATKETLAFLTLKCQQLGSPVIQVFMRPFAKPWVIVCDAREAADILTRRNREFDRSAFFGDLIREIVPGSHAYMPTNSQWKANRALVADAMSPQFLTYIAAPQVWSNTLALVDMWRQKARLAQGRTINVIKDSQYCTVDTIWAATFGEELDASASQARYLASIERLDLPQDPNAVVNVPAVKVSEAYDALVAVAASSEITIKNPLGRRAQWFALRFVPRYARAAAIKEKLIRERIRKASQAFSASAGDNGGKARSAVDLVIEKETKLAKKENRPSQHDSIYVQGELGAFLIAGFETTSTTLSWGLKYLTHYQAVQTELRNALRSAFQGSVDPESQPTAETIAKTPVPYLDAFIDEVLRHSGIAPAMTRTAVVDTTIMGYHIPKGTEVFLMTNGPGIRASAMPIDEHTRSSTSGQTKDEARWQHADLDKFVPERFLVKDADGNLQYDPHAAPMQSFGGGIRACFGRKLAYLEMRMIYTLLVWNFEFKATQTGWSAQDKLAHSPQEVLVRLSEIKDVVD